MYLNNCGSLRKGQASALPDWYANESGSGDFGNEAR
jgi:hypothetical protein